MIPLTYYLFNLLTGNQYVSKLNLFSMSRNSYEEKYWLLGTAMFLIIITLFIKAMLRKAR
jgi:hypothetical protein